MHSGNRAVRIAPDTDVAKALKGCPIRNLAGSQGDPKPDYLVGVFRHMDGRRAVLLQNHRVAYTAWPTVEFDAPLDQVREIGKTTGRPRGVIDDSPDMAGLQVSLDAGEARLFLLPR